MYDLFSSVSYARQYMAFFWIYWRTLPPRWPITAWEMPSGSQVFNLLPPRWPLSLLVMPSGSRVGPML